jgi:23S rRNA (pseudouridine1915-N3)-methyltransferase
MRLWIIAVGTKMPQWVDSAFAEYTKRMPREARIELVEIKPEKRGGKATQQILDAERERILAAVPQNCQLLALDERGDALTTRELAQAMADWMGGGQDVAFVIGGADGLHEDIKRAARRLLALSAMTLPHGLARVVLAEQLYRALTVLQNHPYHRD